MEEKKTHKEMAEELDGMTRGVTSDEANFLEEVFDTLKAGKKLKPKAAEKLEAMYEKYLGEKDEEEGKNPDEEDEREELDSDDLE